MVVRGSNSGWVCVALCFHLLDVDLLGWQLVKFNPRSCPSGDVIKNFRLSKKASQRTPARITSTTMAFSWRVHDRRSFVGAAFWSLSVPIVGLAMLSADMFLARKRALHILNLKFGPGVCVLCCTVACIIGSKPNPNACLFSSSQ